MMTYAWHVHHHILVEPVYGGLGTRISYIMETKPAHEQALRLRLLKPIAGDLPEPVQHAGRAYAEAWRARDQARRAWDEAWRARDDEARRARDDESSLAYAEAWRVWDEAWQAYAEAGRVWDEAVKANMSGVLALHASECPQCPWNGATIFS